MYPLLICYVAIENGPVDILWGYPWKIVIFHSSVNVFQLCTQSSHSAQSCQRPEPDAWPIDGPTSSLLMEMEHLRKDFRLHQNMENVMNLSLHHEECLPSRNSYLRKTMWPSTMLVVVFDRGTRCNGWVFRKAEDPRVRWFDDVPFSQNHPPAEAAAQLNGICSESNGTTKPIWWQLSLKWWSVHQHI